ncbi:MULTISPECIES: DUF2188 domain-containing protein [Legionella]|uniref:DUF2188 domain-containing protein n=1 Tax=Legionella maceachernii TaxID=466 RepID=A0A0W0VXJ1_9GAMM|nr:DUF2188 domain-containing protein [Legionella maceachernii]KTD24891.1 hypothetical protein Lmac_2428 [Legionella maceachernii]SKA16022.1 hypothetical protein SAMN02745128_02336 [Legionella maceachernii]SUP01584.1 Uncharacterised protein [Legionella maceachernii]
MPKISYHIVPRSRGGWDIKQSNFLLPIKHFATKDEAIIAATKMCKKEYATVFIHGHREGIIDSKINPY